MQDLKSGATGIRTPDLPEGFRDALPARSVL